MNVREVWIDETSPYVYFVRYKNRKKYQRHCAAQFDKNFTNKDGVKKWIEKQPNLILKDQNV